MSSGAKTSRPLIWLSAGSKIDVALNRAEDAQYRINTFLAVKHVLRCTPPEGRLAYLQPRCKPGGSIE